MTERLYYTDPYCREFDARVIAVDVREGRTAIALDRTAFYPTSGGQPYDTGLLGGAAVVDVVDEEDGRVVHVIDPAGRVPAVGEVVRGTIDWTRRFDHMQQHTGQHMLSAACDRLFGARTVSFHLGADSSTIDIARELKPFELARVEDEANGVVWEDRPVSIRFATPEEAAALPLRKEPAREGPLRLIDIEGFDLSACGGTHVARTGAVGVIAIASWERFKGGQRLEFVCGARALARFRWMRDTLDAATRPLSVGAQDLAPSIERLLAEAKEQKRVTTALQGDLARYRAEELAAAAEVTPAGRLVLRAVEADANGLKSLAASIAARPGHGAVLVSTGAPALVVVARAGDLAFAANQVLGALTTAFGGRGGGKPDLAQGGGLAAAPEAILAAARTAILS